MNGPLDQQPLILIFILYVVAFIFVKAVELVIVGAILQYSSAIGTDVFAAGVLAAIRTIFFVI